LKSIKVKEKSSLQQFVNIVVIQYNMEMWRIAFWTELFVTHIPEKQLEIFFSSKHYLQN
jgi:hypothetical protein